MKQYGEEVRLEFCPVCNKKKKNPCFSVNTSTKKYYCHATGQGGSIFEFKEIAEELGLKQEQEEERDFFDKFMNNSTKIEDNEQWQEYLKSRKIENLENINKIARFKKNIMLIPISNAKNVVGIKYRTIEKNLWCEKDSSLNYLIGWTRVKDFEYLIICEGEMDLLSVLECGIENVVSLPNGASNLKCIYNLKDWLKQFNKIIIATDNDDAGKKSREKIVNALKDTRVPLYKVNFYKCKDPNEVLVKHGAEKLKSYLLEKAKPIKTDFKEIIEQDGCYYENMKKITDFLIKVESFSDNYLLGKVISRDNEREIKVKFSDILSLRGMVEHIGLFLGSQSSIPFFIDYLKNQNEEKQVKEIEFYGLHGEKYYDEDGEVICGKKDLVITSQSKIDFLTNEERQWLTKNILYMRNDPMQSLIGICWALGRFYNLEEYPILEVSGTTSIGKTEYVEFISRILFGSKENIKSLTTLSNHQIRSFSSCSNITPWAIDEVKITSKTQQERATELYSIIRSIYDNKTINQGNTTSKLTEFKLCTPLIISGESELADVSIKNRMVSTKLTRANKGDIHIYKTLKTTNILEKLGKEALKNRLQNPNISVDIDIDDERQKHNAKCLLCGLEALKGIIRIDDAIVEKFKSFIKELFTAEYNIVENFKELLLLAENSGYKKLGEIYQRNKTNHCAKFQELYKLIAEEHRKTNSTLELLDMKTLRQQLEEENFIERKNVAMRMPELDENGSIIGTSVKKVVIFKNL